MSSPIKAGAVHRNSSARPVSYSPRHSSPVGPAPSVANGNPPARSSLLAQPRPSSRPPPPPPVPPSFDFELERYSSSVRLIASWEETARRYVDVEDDDEIDLRTGQIVKDRGKLRNMDAVRYFGDDPLSSEDEPDFIDVDADDLGGWDETQFERGAVKQEIDSEDDRSFFALPAPPMMSKRNPLDEEDLKQFMREEARRKNSLGIDQDDRSSGSESEPDALPASDGSQGEDSQSDAIGWDSAEDVNGDDDMSSEGASDDHEDHDRDPLADDWDEEDDDPLASSPVPSEALRRSRPSVEPLQFERRTSSLLSRPPQKPVKPAKPSRRRRRHSTNHTYLSDDSSSEASPSSEDDTGPSEEDHDGASSDLEYAPDGATSEEEPDDGEEDDEIDLLDELPFAVRKSTSPPIKSRPTQISQRGPMSPPPSQSPPPDTMLAGPSCQVPRHPDSLPPPSFAPYDATASSSTSATSRLLPTSTLSATAHLRPFFYRPPRPSSLPPSSTSDRPFADLMAALPTPPLSTVSSTSSSSTFALPSSILNAKSRRVRFDTTAEEEEDMSPLRPVRRSLHRKTSRDEIKPLISRAYADELKGIEILEAYRAERKKRKREERAEGKGKKSRKRGKMGLAIVDATSGLVGGAENAVEDRPSSEERDSDPNQGAQTSTQDADEVGGDLKAHPSTKRRRIVDSPSLEPEATRLDDGIELRAPTQLSVLPRPSSYERPGDQSVSVKREESPLVTVPGPRLDPILTVASRDPSEIAIVELSKLAEDIAGPRKPRQRDALERTLLTTPTLLNSLKKTIAMLQLSRETARWGQPHASSSRVPDQAEASVPLPPSSLIPNALPSCSNCVLHDRPLELANACLGRLHLPTVLPLPDLAHTYANPSATAPTFFCSFLDMAPSSVGRKKRKRSGGNDDEPFSLDAYIASLPDAPRASSASRSTNSGVESRGVKRRL